MSTTVGRGCRLLMALSLCGSLALWGISPVWGASQFILLDQPILTLRTPVGSTQTRLESLEQRFQQIIAQSQPPLVVTVQGNQTQAQILLNEQVMLEVTPADATANATTQVDALARLWAERLQAVLSQPVVQQQLFRAVGLPEQIRFQGRVYQRQSDPVTDLGRFYTDGSRAEERVIFWEVDPSQTDRALTSAPVAIYLLNVYRQYVLYRPF